MTTQEELSQYQSKIERAKTERAQAEGSLATIMASLKANHGVDTLEEAETLRASLETQIQAGEAELSDLLASVRKMFADAGL
jgi:uncharacterized protein (UPF0335 family)